MPADVASLCGSSGRITEAAQWLTRALALRPDSPKALALAKTLAEALGRQGEEEAMEVLNRELERRPEFPQALSNLGNALREAGDPTAAIGLFERALAIRPDFVEARYNLSLTLLQVGRYAEGWESYEWRWKREGRQNPIAQPPTPLWQAGAGGKEPVLLVAEQGLGDVLQFVRYALLLKERAASVGLCVPAKLAGLLEGSGLAARVLGAAEGEAWREGPWLPLLSLPRQLGVTAERPLLDGPYLRVPPERVAYWRERLGAGGGELLVGVHWQGNPRTERQGLRGRSFALEVLAPLAELEGVRLVSLQKGEGSEQLAECGFRERFVDCQVEVEEAWDFVETGAIASACDLVISSDSALAHLCGGLGVTTWLLLHDVPDWRWGLSGERTGWYRSMRLFRQRQRGNWAEVVERVRQALAERLAAAGASSSVPVAAPAAVADEEESEQAALWRAGRCLQEGRLEEAEGIYRQRIGAGTEAAAAYGNLAAICGMTGRLGEVEGLLERALALEPGSAEAWANLGIARRRRGDPAGAIEAYERSLALRSEQPAVQYNLGIARREQGDLSGAVAAFRAALALRPDYPEALRQLAALLRKL